MAENVGKIEYVASIDLAEFIKNQREIDARLDGLEKSSGKLEATMTKVARAVATLVSVAAVKAAFDVVVNAAAKFESTLADLGAISGVSGKALKAMGEEAKTLAKTTTASAGETVTAMKLIASAKPELLETQGALAAVTKEAIALAEASGMALPEAANVVALSLNQFGASANEANRFVNVLAAGAKFGASEINETGIALKNSAVSAHAASVSFEETNAAIQALAATGIKGGEAGTALRNVLLKLENDTDKTLKPSINGLAGALENLNKKNYDSASLTKIFGLENVNAAQALLGSTAQVRQLTKDLTGTNTAYEQAAANTATYEAALKKMHNALDIAAVKLGDLLLPILTKGADAIQQLAVAFVDGSDGMTKAVTVMENALVLLTGSMIGRLSPAIVAFVATTYTAVTAMGAGAVAARVFGAALTLMGGPIGIAITALGLLALNWDKINDSARSAAEISEDSAVRIQKALAKGGAAAEKSLVEQLALAEKEAAATKKDVNARGLVARKPEMQKEIEDRAKAAEAAVLNLKAALDKVRGADKISTNPFDSKGVAPEAPKKGPQNTLPDKEKKHKFDSEAYLFALKKQSMTELDIVDATEAEDQRIREQHLKLNEISLAQSEQAKVDIAAKAAGERDKIAQRLYDAEIARNAEEREARQQLADENKALDEAEAQRKLAAQDAVRQITGDPIAELTYELETKSQLIADAEARDYVTKEQAEAARFALSKKYAEETAAVVAAAAAKEAAINSARLQDGATLFAGLADLTKAFAGEQSGAYKALFAVSKAFAIADSIIKIQQGIANAMSLPWPANLAAAASTAAAAAGIIGTIKGTSMPSRQYGGPLAAGQVARVNETGQPEMWTSQTGEQYMMPNKRGQVTSAKDLAKQAPAPRAPAGDVRLILNGTPMPNGMFLMNPNELANQLKSLRQDGYLNGQ